MGKSPGEPTACRRPRSAQPAPLKPIRRQPGRDPRSPRRPGTQPLPGRRTPAAGPPPAPAGAPRPVTLHVLHGPPRHAPGSRPLRARPGNGRGNGRAVRRTKERGAGPRHRHVRTARHAGQRCANGRAATPRSTRPRSAPARRGAAERPHQTAAPRRPRRLGPPVAQPQGLRKRARRTSRHGEREAGGATGRYRKGRSAGAGVPCSPCPWRCPPCSRPAARRGAAGGAGGAAVRCGRTRTKGSAVPAPSQI